MSIRLWLHPAALYEYAEGAAIRVRRGVRGHTRRAGTAAPVGTSISTKSKESPISKETPKDDPRQKSDQGSHRQTDKPWKGNPEKEQRNDDAKIDLEKWQETNTH